MALRIFTTLNNAARKGIGINMDTNQQKELILTTLAENLDLPSSAYERAKRRYEDLGEWFNRDECSLKDNDVHIFPQGSFMLGTSIRPLTAEEEYDLDLACKMRVGINKFSHTQHDVKELVGHELELYRKARGIKEELSSKHRCWRLEYQDDISFHLDIVPAIPADDVKKALLFESMYKTGAGQYVAKGASDTAMSITDDRDPNFNRLSDDWNISNPEGYKFWFFDRMRTTESRILLEKAQVDRVPEFKEKTPLQIVVQLLKRHRDMMFGDDESKPISIIITTLAARAYSGEGDVVEALNNILERMPNELKPSTPRVPNPVNPEEDFADRWAMPKYAELQLEENFFIWLQQAKLDFEHVTTSNDPVYLSESFNTKFSVKMNADVLEKKLNISRLGTKSSHPTKEHQINEPIKPWGSS